MNRSLASQTLIERCGETLYAVEFNLASEGPDAVMLGTALHTLANAAEGASLLLHAANDDPVSGDVMAVDAAALEALLRARAAVEHACSLLAVLPVEDCPPPKSSPSSDRGL